MVVTVSYIDSTGAEQSSTTVRTGPGGHFQHTVTVTAADPNLLATQGTVTATTSGVQGQTASATFTLTP